jgi:GT2 family glycosyltransferase
MSALAVHIVTHNNAATLNLCLESVRCQQLAVPLHIRLFDNASSDATRQIAAQYAHTLIESPVNLGYAAAHNRLLALSDEPYVLTLNPDVRLAPDFCAHVLRALGGKPRAGMAAACLLRCETLHAPPESVDGAGLFMRRSRRQGLIAENAPLERRPLQAAEIFGVDGAAACYRRQMLREIALDGEIFDEDFFMHKEDVDLCWRAQLCGWRCIYVPEAQAQHIRTFRPNQRKRVPTWLRRLAVRNRYLLLLKNDFPAHLLRDALPFVTYEIGILAYMLLREPRSLIAYAQAWQLRKKMLIKRRLLRAKRRVTWRDLRHWFC